MAFATVPRDGKIFDEQTADCLNTQISILDNKIDNYKVNDLSFQKTVKQVKNKIINDRYIKNIEDYSFFVENIYCLRLKVPISSNSHVRRSSFFKWHKIATLPVDLPYEYTGMIYSDEGYNWYYKIDKNNKVWITGKTEKAKDTLNICVDLILLKNPLII